MATTLAAAAAPMSPAPPRRRGRPPKKPAPAPAPRSPSPVSPLAAAAEEATAVKAEAEAEAEGYEREREERIRENMERMQKLGLLDLSFQLNQAASASPASGRALRSRSATPCYPPAARERLSAAPPARRSLRLKSVSPVSYSESCITKDKNLDHGSSDLIEKGSKEEVYTEEHEKLLGTCEATWTLFVDGYGKDGKRIYDQVRGQTCHQCRQKTLGHHTHCSQCKIVQGQFCGDCLYMRYGENVLEAKKNPNWICPVCRGICNCSLCRTKKGWFPTGSLYRKVVSLGYKSVAHYLIQTRRSSAGSADSNSADSSNKLLPCTKSATSSTSENYPVADHESESAEMSSKIDNEESKMQGKSSDESKDEITNESQGKNANGCEDESRSESAVPSSALDCQANQDTGSDTPAKGRPKKRKLIERSPDCVATRLRSRSNKS